MHTSHNAPTLLSLPCTCRGGWPERSEGRVGCEAEKVPHPSARQEPRVHPPPPTEIGLARFQQIDRPSRASPAWVGGGKKRTIATASSAAPAVARYVHPVAAGGEKGHPCAELWPVDRSRQPR